MVSITRARVAGIYYIHDREIPRAWKCYPAWKKFTANNKVEIIASSIAIFLKTKHAIFCKSFV